jgi:hypothetical protein
MQRNRTEIIKQRDSIIHQINKAIPEAMAAPSADFYGDDSLGIWLRGSEEYTANGERVFNYYELDEMLHSKIVDILNNHKNWYSEPYDPGTCMLWYN